MRSFWKSVDHPQANCPGILIKRKKIRNRYAHTQEECHVEIKTETVFCKYVFRAVLGSQHKG